MHYFIDGYNLLFRSAWSRHSDDLETMRSKLIAELDRAAEFLHLHITLVFDAPLLIEGLQRGHFRSLEIIYTSHGQTADEYLLSIIEGLKKPREATLVTSDKGLRAQARAFGVHVEPVEQFTSALKKRVLKRQLKKAPVLEKKKAPTLVPQPKKAEKSLAPAIEQKIDSPPKRKKALLPPLSDFAAWEKIFESRLGGSIP